MHITFALPALLWPNPPTTLPPLHSTALNVLRRWGRLQAQPCRRSDFYARYLGQHSWLAAIRRHTHTDTAHAALLCSPISQTVGMHQAPFLSGSLLHLSLPEAQDYCQALSDFFQPEHITFTAWTPTLWLLNLPQHWSFEAPRLWDLHGSMSKDSKPQGQDAPQVLQVLTACQMLLYQHPHNQQRQQQGRPPINGLWLEHDLSGQAHPEACLLTPHDWAMQAQPVPHDLRTWLDSLTDNPFKIDQAVLFLDELTHCADHADAAAYAATLHTWDTHWFAPAQQALLDKRIHTVDIATDGPHGGILHIRKPWLPTLWPPASPFDGQHL